MIKELGGKILTVVPSTVGKVTPMGSPDDEWRWAIESLKECQDHAEKQGVRLGLEPLNRFETYFLNRGDQALALAEDVGGDCGVCLDIFHMNIEEADWPAAIRNAGDKLVDFHVADNNRMPPGQGRSTGSCWSEPSRTPATTATSRWSSSPLSTAAASPSEPRSETRRRLRRASASSSSCEITEPAPFPSNSTTGTSRSPSTPCASTSGPGKARGRRERGSWTYVRTTSRISLRRTSRATWRRRNIVMVPIASMEQHGPHLPRSRRTRSRRTRSRCGRLTRPSPLHALRLVRLLPPALVRPGCRHRDHHRQIPDPARGLPRRRPVAHPPRLQPTGVRQQPRVEREDHRPAPAPHPLRDRCVRRILQAVRGTLLGAHRGRDGKPPRRDAGLALE